LCGHVSNGSASLLIERDPRQAGCCTASAEQLAVKLNIGAPMSQGVVEVKRIREYIRAHGGYQVDPVASPNWVLMPDGSTRSARRHEVAIYTFLVPQNERKKIAHHIKQEGYHVLDVLPDE
jgi:hypothetical protein